MESATLRVGHPAPPFELPIANGEGTLSLAQLVERGPAIVEFVRGVW